MWQYEVLGLDAAHEMMTLYERLQKMGDCGDSPTKQPAPHTSR